MQNSKTVAIILASGRGRRMQSLSIPKQYTKINNSTILFHTINAFINNPKINSIMVAIHEDDEELFFDSIKNIKHKKDINYTFGGPERQKSSLNALEKISEQNPKYVLIHDGVRPFVSQSLINKILETLQTNTSAIPIMPTSEAMKRVIGNKIVGSVNRTGIYTVQTPQGFLYKDIIMCHKLAKFNMHVDDSSMFEAYNLPLTTISGECQNIKITNDNDLQYAKILAQYFLHTEQIIQET